DRSRSHLRRGDHQGKNLHQTRLDYAAAIVKAVACATSLANKDFARLQKIKEYQKIDADTLKKLDGSRILPQVDHLPEV
ncbi:unnamed protein product, partial [Amoebophrya sp. A25]